MPTDVVSFLLEHIFDIITLAVTVTGGVFALYELRLSVKSNRAGYVNTLLDRITQNDDIQYFLNYVDYDSDWYTEEFHHGTDEQRSIARKADKTLFTFNYICYLYSEKMINEKEMKIFDYYLFVLAHDEELGCYFLDLYQYAMLNNDIFPFGYFLDFCIRNGGISAAVKDERYFYELMKYESDLNAKKKPSCPQEILNVRSRYGNNLYINSVFRCDYCKHFDRNSSTCPLKGAGFEEHYKMTSGTPCDKFDFVKARWKEINML